MAARRKSLEEGSFYVVDNHGKPIGKPFKRQEWAMAHARHLNAQDNAWRRGRSFAVARAVRK